MLCPILAQAYVEKVGQQWREMSECQKNECAWWLYVLGERLCAIAALAQLARMAYENQGK